MPEHGKTMQKKYLKQAIDYAKPVRWNEDKWNEIGGKAVK
jgi:hypothetical protein